jgi:crotonobetainyl-CoA:carnitine CoA-transferase CaiB-like acyl-CoA transferase
MSNVLEDTIVLDLTRFLSGPHCTLLLAGLGAEVIKIDDPETGDPAAAAPPFAGPQGIAMEKQTDADLGIAYLKRTRDKKSLNLNLKNPRGKEVFFELIKSADVVVENFRVGVTERLGISYADVKKHNPRIIYCSLTGYGSSGPDCNLKAYDLMVQAATGLMSITGTPGGGPVKAGSPLSDTIAGSHAALGVVSALFNRERTGQGQSIDVSMSDCLLSMLFDEPLDCYARLGLNPQQGNRIMRFSPFNSYRTSDGWVVIGAATQEDWTTLIEIIGREDLKSNPDMIRVGWRIMHNAEVDKIVQSWTIDKTTKEVVALLATHDVPCSPVRSVDEVLKWSHAKARNSLVDLPHPGGCHIEAVAPGFPLKFSKSKAGYQAAAPLPGQHTAELLRRFLGIGDDALQELRKQGVI